MKETRNSQYNCWSL